MRYVVRSSPTAEPSAHGVGIDGAGGASLGVGDRSGIERVDGVDAQLADPRQQVPPGFTVGRRHRRNTSVIVPYSIPRKVASSRSTAAVWPAISGRRRRTRR